MNKQDVIDYFGTAKAVAQVMDCTTANVYLWPDEIVWERQCAIEMLTNGKLKADRNIVGIKLEMAKIIRKRAEGIEAAKAAGL